MCIKMLERDPMTAIRECEGPLTCLSGNVRDGVTSV